jgi:hypothetical protein
VTHNAAPTTPPRSCFVGVVSWQSAGNDRAVAAVQPQNLAAANSAQPTGSVKHYVVRSSYNGQKKFLFEMAVCSRAGSFLTSDTALFPALPAEALYF